MRGFSIGVSTWQRGKPARVPLLTWWITTQPRGISLCSRHCSCHRTIYLSFFHFIQSFFLFPVFFICHPPLSLFPQNRWFCQAYVRLLLTHVFLKHSLILCPSRSHLPFRIVSTLSATKAIYFPARLAVAQVQTRISGNRAASRPCCFLATLKPYNPSPQCSRLAKLPSTQGHRQICEMR